MPAAACAPTDCKAALVRWTAPHHAAAARVNASAPSTPGRDCIRAEGFHGEVKSWHGLARAVRHGLPNILIQAYFTAAAINLKRLVAALIAPLAAAVHIGLAHPRCHR